MLSGTLLTGPLRLRQSDRRTRKQSRAEVVTRDASFRGLRRGYTVSRGGLQDTEKVPAKAILSLRAEA
ncbi:hypothetical protein NDU88_005371 [Pleurodeles waltl]|uniref:Uncharacterized protein n=1 Tax=Pleurodeles waltl TaxID=8319 RepID=A0AAV7VML0_PLEWA|nr:hypothetical protein NDU88_005371 [Pleurodeles waltl]